MLANYLKGEDLSGGSIAPVQGEHSGIGKDAVFKKSAGNAITPDKPPETIFGVHRSMPVFDRPREFNPEEAEGMAELAKEKRQNAKATKKAADAHESILESDAKINRHSQRMIRNEARFEVKAQGYKGTTAKTLQSLRPRYAGLGQGLEKAEQAADQAIQQLMGQL